MVKVVWCGRGEIMNFMRANPWDCSIKINSFKSHLIIRLCIYPFPYSYIWYIYNRTLKFFATRKSLKVCDIKDCLGKDNNINYCNNKFYNTHKYFFWIIMKKTHLASIFFLKFVAYVSLELYIAFPHFILWSYFSVFIGKIETL